MEEKQFERYDWNTYKEMLEKFNYTEEQISAVKEIRENPEYELMSPEQFDFLWRQGVIKRTRKLKKPRSLIVVGDKIMYLEHYEKRYCWCGEFVNEE